jgi:hypothetical protein
VGFELLLISLKNALVAIWKDPVVEGQAFVVVACKARINSLLEHVSLITFV